MTVVGELGLWVALFLAVWGSVAPFVGAAIARSELLESGRRAVVASAAMVALACLGLWTALFRHEFSLEYVAAHTSLTTPGLYLFTAFWAAPPGLMLFFALTLSVCGAAAVLRQPWSRGEQTPWVIGALAAVLALVLIAVCFVTNPYDRMDWVPAEGQGLDPRMQSPIAGPYYVATYWAYGAGAIPFALATGAVMVRSTDESWSTSVGRWTVVTWCLLTLGIGLRMRWTYLQPDGGGLWRPDLPEAATIGCWIASLLLVWSFGARPTTPSPRSAAALAFTTFALALAAAASLPRPPRPETGVSQASATGSLTLIGFGIVATGVIVLASRRLRGKSADTTRRRGVPATLTVYAGLVLLLAGVVASRWWTAATVELRPGEATELTDPYGRRWRFVSQGISRDERMSYLSTGIAVEAWRDGAAAGIIGAERRQYLDSVRRPIYAPTPRPGVRSSLALDVYIVLTEVRDETAQLRVAFRPLVALVWIGWFIVLAGGLVLGGIAAARPMARADVARPAAA